MAQIKVSASLVNGSAAVVVAGEDLRPIVHAGFLVTLAGELGGYLIGAEPTFLSPNTTINLTAPYAGSTGVKNIVIVSDFTSPDEIPLLNPGDVNTGTIFTEAMLRIQELISTLGPEFALQKNDNLADLEDAAEARVNLGLGNVENKSSATIRGELEATDVTDALGYTPWHAGNDGAGSGVDADLLDGQQGAYYRDASNLNAGTLAAARLGASPTASKLLWGDNTWKALVAADITSALTFTPLNRAADTMQGDLSFAAGTKIVQASEFGVKRHLSGSAVLEELNAANTSWDFTRASGTVDKWRFMDAANVRLQVDANGVLINGFRLKATATGLLALEDGTTDQELRIHNAGGANWEALRLYATDTGAWVTADKAGTGTHRALTVGSVGNVDLNLYRNGAIRWIVRDSALIPNGAYDLGATANPVRDLWTSRRVYVPTGTLVDQPPVAGSTDSDTGLRWSAADELGLVTGGVQRLTVGTSAITAELPLWLGTNLKLDQEGLGIFSLKNGLNAQSLRAYLQDDGAGNWTRGVIDWSAGKLRLTPEVAGTDVLPALRLDGATLELGTLGTSRLTLGTSAVTPITNYALGSGAAPFGELVNTSLKQYRDYGDASNNEWAGSEWISNDWVLGSRQNGSGQYRNVVVRAGEGAEISQIRFDTLNAIASLALETSAGVQHALFSSATGVVRLTALQSKALELVAGANKVQIKNGLLAQSFEIYNTDDGAGNAEFGEFRFSSGKLIFGTKKIGTGVSRDLQFEAGGNVMWGILANGGHLEPTTPATMDVGTAANPIRDLYIDGTIQGTSSLASPPSLKTVTHSLFGGF